MNSLSVESGSRGIAVVYVSSAIPVLGYHSRLPSAHSHTQGMSASFLIPTTTCSKAALVLAGCTLEPPRYPRGVERIR